MHKPINNLNSTKDSTWESVTSSSGFSARFNNAQQLLTTVSSLAASYEATPLHMLWAFLSAASAATAHRARVMDPITRRNVNLSMGVILLGPPGRWADGLKSWVRQAVSPGPVYLSEADSAERAGFIAEIQSAQKQNYSKKMRKFDDEVDEAIKNISSVEDLMQFDTTDLDAGDVPYSTHVYHLPARINYFFNASGRGSQDVYQHFYTGLRGDPIIISHKNELIRLYNVMTSIFAASSIQEFVASMPNADSQLSLLARMNLVYSPAIKTTGHVRFDADSYTQVAEMLTSLKKAEAGYTILNLTKEAAVYFSRVRNVAGIGAVAAQMTTYQAARSEHLLRIAALIALLKNPETATVHEDDVRVADWILVGQEGALASVYLTLTMGEHGKALGFLLDEIQNARQNPGHRNLTVQVVKGWLVTSGIKAERAQKILDDLLFNSLLKVTDEGNVDTALLDSSIRLEIAMRRVGLTD